MSTIKLKGVAGLDAAVKGILEEYAKDATKTTQDCAEEVTKAGVKALKQESNAKFNPANAPANGRYSTGWTSKVEKGRLTAEGIIYNSKYPGLPHLLEYGHALKTGGRSAGTVRGREHIAPVEEKIVAEFEAKLKARL